MSGDVRRRAAKHKADMRAYVKAAKARERDAATPTPTVGRTCPECGDEVTPGTIGCDE
jgi:hypothetical protein